MLASFLIKHDIMIYILVLLLILSHLGMLCSQLEKNIINSINMGNNN